VNFDAVIGGLDRPPSVGAFDLVAQYDASLLSPISVTFGAFLGAVPSEAITAEIPGNDLGVMERRGT
jgi:hypothetical protein